MTFSEKLLVYFKSNCPLIGIETHEEGRVIDSITPVARQMPSARVLLWDSANGLIEVTDPKQDKKIMITGVGGVAAIDDLKKLISWITSCTDNAVFILKDAHTQFSDAKTVRGLRSLIPSLSRSISTLVDDKPGTLWVRQTVILISPRLNLPLELQKDVQLMEFSLPTSEERLKMVSSFIEDSFEDKATRPNPNDSERLAIAEASAGMTSLEFVSALSACVIMQKQQEEKITMKGTFPKLVFEEKVLALKNGLLEYVPNTPSFDEIGGMEPLKTWAMTRRLGFEDKARKLNLPNPKGALLVGPPGTGKSYVVGAIANAFGFPLFKMDVGRLFGSKVGESEANVRELIRLMERIGRAVVMFDEIDKSLSRNSTTGGGDSGTSSRVFGSLLSWMAIKKEPVFVVATANNIDVLPPELIRKGRFDEVWWVDMPKPDERQQIFNSLLKYRFKNKLQIKSGSSIVKDSEGFSGAEIAAVVEDALYVMLDSDDDLDHILQKLVQDFTPQSRLDASYFDAMREKAKKGYKMANSVTVVAPVKKRSGRTIDVS